MVYMIRYMSADSIQKTSYILYGYHFHPDILDHFTWGLSTAPLYPFYTAFLDFPIAPYPEFKIAFLRSDFWCERFLL